PFVNAAGWLLSRNILENIGGFDPIFFHYGEDDNYCQRAQYHGFKIGIVPNAFLLHDREDRTPQKIEFGSIAFFKQMERCLKMKYANINAENLEALRILLSKRKKNNIKAILKMKFSQVEFLNKEIALLTQLLPE